MQLLQQSRPSVYSHGLIRDRNIMFTEALHQRYTDIAAGLKAVIQILRPYCGLQDDAVGGIGLDEHFVLFCIQGQFVLDADPLHLMHGFVDIRIVADLNLHEISHIFYKIGIGDDGGIHNGIGHDAALSIKLPDNGMPDRYILNNPLCDHA